ncbi:MAG: hypothetical protein WDN30_10660 [Pararobbsia sp.]
MANVTARVSGVLLKRTYKEGSPSPAGPGALRDRSGVLQGAARQ